MFKQITHKQKEVLILISKGLLDKEIARELGISYGTVRDYVSNIKLRLSASTRAQVVAIALKRGIIE